MDDQLVQCHRRRVATYASCSAGPPQQTSSTISLSLAAESVIMVARPAAHLQFNSDFHAIHPDAALSGYQLPARQKSASRPFATFSGRCDFVLTYAQFPGDAFRQTSSRNPPTTFPVPICLHTHAQSPGKLLDS